MDASPNWDNFQEKIMKKLDNLQNYMEENILHLNYNVGILKMRQEQHNIKILPRFQTNCQLSLSKNTRTEQYEIDMAEVHKAVLKENLESMVKDIDLENTGLLDDLQTGECLTSDEAAEIIRKPVRRDQVRKLVLHIGRKSRQRFTTFLEKLQKSSNYPYLAQNLMDSYNRKTNEISNATQMSKCLVCVLKHDVLVKDVIDKLFSKSLISAEVYELSIDSSEINNSTIWDTVLIHLKRCGDPRKARQVLQEALANKYEHIAAKINKTRFPDIMCRCQNLATNLFVQGSLRSDSTGSLGDISTTSEQKVDSTIFSRDFHHKRSESNPSETSDNSTQVDFTNIPATVAWLASIPNANGICEPENDRHDRFASDVIQQLEIDGNEADSASQTYAGHDSSGTKERSVANIDQLHNFIKTSFKESPRENDNDSMSYASVVSGKCLATKPVPAEINVYGDSNTGTAFNRMISTSSNSSKASCLSNDKRKSVESLNEIGTLYLSKVQTNQTTDYRPKSQRNPKQSQQTKKQKSRSKALARQNVVVDEKSLETRSLENSTILEKVFFEEQRKIHSDLLTPDDKTYKIVPSRSEEKNNIYSIEGIRQESKTMETGQNSSDKKTDSQFKVVNTKRKNKKGRKNGK